MPLDRERLTKLMGLTTSTNDHEALAALRKANEIVLGEKLTWRDVLGETPTRNVTVTVTRHGMQQAPGAGGASDEWMPPHLKDKVIIDLMFRAVFSQPRSDNEEFWQFMDSVHNRWQKYANLSQGQYTALQRCYQRATRSNPVTS